MGKRASSLQFAPIPVNIDSDPDLQKFQELLCLPRGSDEALRLYVRLWLYVCSSDPTRSGAFETREADRLADICRWDGDSQILLAAWLGSGLLVETRGQWCLNGWQNHAGPLVAMRQSDRERGLGRKLRQTVIARDAGRCRYCGCVPVETHIDHVRPVSRGGRSVIENLVVACAPCNLAKGAKEVAKCP